MGCGCRGGVRGTGRRPVVTPSQRSVGRGIAKSSPRQLELRAQSAQDSKDQTKSAHLDKQLRELERRRRMNIARRNTK